MSAEQIVGSFFNQFFPKNEIQKYTDLLQAGLKGKTDGELAYKKDDNTRPRYLHLSFSPLPPELLGDICIMAADITELKQKEAELRYSHVTLEQHVVERTAELNKVIEELANSQRTTLRMMNDAVEAKNKLDILNLELATQYEEKAKRTSELIEALASAEDFENKFKQIAENIEEVFWLRTESEMIYVSPSFEKIWGVPCQEIYENPQIFTENIHPEDKALVNEIYHSNEFKENGLFEYEYRILRSENQVRWVNAKTVPIVDENGQIVKRVGIASDITEKKERLHDLVRSKAKAEESNNLKSAFLANMSHEIRTPMNGILGFAALLKEPHLSDKLQQEYIRTIEKSGARMLNIINNIVDISKIESGLMEVNRTVTNVNEQLDYVNTFFKPETEKSNCS